MPAGPLVMVCEPARKWPYNVVHPTGLGSFADAWTLDELITEGLVVREPVEIVKCVGPNTEA